MQFKGHVCVYCLTNPSTPTGDHIFARKFFLVHQRGNLPKVPCCESCGNKKAQLEAYLMGVLPFGGRHADAATNLSTMVPKRLAKNKRTHRTLAHGTSRVWVRGKSGIVARHLTVPIDGDKLEKLFAYIAKGLMWHHWRISLGPDCFAEAHLPTLSQQRQFVNLLQMRAATRVHMNLGNGTFTYAGAQGGDNPQISMWEFEVYGGVEISGGLRPHQAISRIYAMTGPMDVKVRAERRLRAGAFIVRP
jgi:hypothetical protein